MDAAEFIALVEKIHGHLAKKALTAVKNS